ncbi:MAG TPA: 7-cyano-7-deazaguanine synthase [Tepidisphaeraceae bacterium]|jgi:7-cyano-7-deazaguanine synthase
MAKETAIVLNNGSLDSAVVSALAAQAYRPVFLHVEPGTAGPPTRRKVAYTDQAAHFKPFREHTLTIPLPSLAGDAAATDPRAVESVTQGLQRLTPMIGLAIHLAAAYQSVAIYVGLRVGPRVDDLARATEYLQVWDELVQMTLERPALRVVAPLLEMELWQAVDLGFQVNAPLDRTWSCVDEHGDPCNACRGCRSRDAAFMQAAKPDPLKTTRTV